MSPNFSRFTIQKRNPFDSEIGNCIEEKFDSSPPRYYPFSPPSENSILRLFFATVFPFFSIPPTLSNNYTFSSPLSKKGKEESQGMNNVQSRYTVAFVNLVKSDRDTADRQ